VAGESDVLDAVYYDSDNLSLLSHGITLRRREGGGDQGWHLKLPGSDDSRTELQLPLADGTAAPPPELLRHARVYAGGAELSPWLTCARTGSAHCRSTRGAALWPRSPLTASPRERSTRRSRPTADP